MGDLRFRPPQSYPGWGPTVRDATRFNASCLQPPEGWPSISTDVPFSEDCLFVNVYSPSSALGTPGAAPVMVYQ